MTAKGSVAVVGAGLAGLTAAFALLRSGWRVCVYEQAPVLGEVGAGISLSAGAGAWSGRARHRADDARKVDIQVMPRSFQTALDDDELHAGAKYDHGVFLYAYGSPGDGNAGLRPAIADFVRGRFPDLAPKRILALGCGTGMSTHPLAAAWPAQWEIGRRGVGAECYGADPDN